MNTKNCKEEILENTIKLIQEKDGDIDKVTIRDITEKCNISVGLINYHFGNKENLIVECIHKLVSEAITSYKPDLTIGQGKDKIEACRERVTASAQKVFNFLFECSAVSKVSILNDFNKYSGICNSANSTKEICDVIGDAVEDEHKKQLIAYTLTNAIQVAFLETMNEKHLMGYDFSMREDREKYIKDIVDMLIR